MATSSGPFVAGDLCWGWVAAGSGHYRLRDGVKVDVDEGGVAPAGIGRRVRWEVRRSGWRIFHSVSGRPSIFVSRDRVGVNPPPPRPNGFLGYVSSWLEKKKRIYPPLTGYWDQLEMS